MTDRRRPFTLKVAAPAGREGDDILQDEYDVATADAVSRFDRRVVLLVRQDGTEETVRVVDAQDRLEATIVVDDPAARDWSTRRVVPVADVRRVEVLP